MNILALGSHPDDIEIGCGGTLIHAAKEEHKVYLGIMTDGSAGGDPQTRKQEQKKSAEIIGVQKVFWGPYEDTKLPISKESIGIIDSWIQEINPSHILVNYSEDTHQDHRNLTKIAVAAARHIKNVLFYEVPSSMDFFPVIFSDIASVFHIKAEALQAHASQLSRTHSEQVSIVEVANAAAHFRGVQGKLDFAEGFIPQRLSMTFGE